MVSSLYSPHIFPTNSIFQTPQKFSTTISIFNHNNPHISSHFNDVKPSTKLPLHVFRNFCVPLAVSSLILWSNPAQAGFLSGFAGIESVPGPKLPSVDFLNRYNEDYQKKYADNDERIKSSPIIKELLERSKLNKDKNKQEIMDKYCLRGAEWGVGDCSTEGMTPDERDAFIDMLKKKAGLD